MSNDYKYVDPDYVYTDPKTGVLRNLENISTYKALTFAETTATARRAKELRAHPILVESADTLFAIHRYLFQDIYKWAGKKRTVEISKGGKQFFPLQRFDTALLHIDSLIAAYKRINRDDKQALSRKLAEILDSVNYLHPFREGNGRAQRELLRLLALEKGWKLNLNPPDNAAVYERYMAGTISGDKGILAELIFECLNGD
ncbi:MAG: Fic family protein [Deltaproteobacteria bacterium]|jgi:cell filamentation protein|nr:Fic family protein [Deltaproteobacteria bacterium]